MCIRDSYTDVDANMSVDLGSDIMKNVNNGVYQIRVKAENAESDEEYKAYTLRISTKSGNTGIEPVSYTHLLKFCSFILSC